jgi:hypothetical protein
MISHPVTANSDALLPHRIGKFYHRVCHFRRICEETTSGAGVGSIKILEDAEVQCYHEDYCGFKPEPEESFGLLISLSADFISQASKHFLNLGDLLLVKDSHYDARRAYVDSDYQLLGAFEGESHFLGTSEQELAAYFQSTKGKSLILEMVEACARRLPSTAPFKLAQASGGLSFSDMKDSNSSSLHEHLRLIEERFRLTVSVKSSSG